jgi:hypothetical protein
MRLEYSADQDEDTVESGCAQQGEAAADIIDSAKTIAGTVQTVKPWRRTDGRSPVILPCKFIYLSVPVP